MTETAQELTEPARPQERPRVDLKGRGALGRLQRFVYYVTHLPPFHGSVLLQSTAHLLSIRRFFARRYLAGHGIEIGAQNLPTPLDENKASVTYVDRLEAEATANYFKMPLDSLVPVEHVCDASDLATIEDGSLDFVVANHVLEHLDDPLGGLLEWLRVIRPNGVLFLSVPNYRANEYDFQRRPVPLSHLIRDFEDEDHRGEGKLEHYRDFVRNAEFEQTDPCFDDRVQDLLEIDDRIHFHVYDYRLMNELVLEAQKRSGSGLRLVDQFHRLYAYEILLVLRKLPDCEPRSLPSRRHRWRNLALLYALTLPADSLPRRLMNAVRRVRP